MLRTKIDRASAVLQIVGDAYGSEPPEPDDDFGRCSFTQYEAMYGKSVGKPVYYLVATAEHPRDALAATVDAAVEATREAIADADEKKHLQSKYKQRVLRGRTIYYEVANYDATENKVVGIIFLPEIFFKINLHSTKGLKIDQKSTFRPLIISNLMILFRYHL